MMRFAWMLVFVGAVLSVWAPTTSGQVGVQIEPALRPPASDVERAFDHLALERHNIRIRSTDRARLTNNQRAGSVLSYLHEQPFSSKAFAQDVRASLFQELQAPAATECESPFWAGMEGFDRSRPSDVSPAAVANVLSRLSGWADRLTRRTLLGDPIREDMAAAARPEAMTEAITALHVRAGSPLSVQDRERLLAQTQKLPIAIRRACALLLRVSDRAIEARDRAIRKFDRSLLSESATLAEVLEFVAANDTDRDRLTQFELSPMIALSQELALALSVSAIVLDRCECTPVEFHWETPYGRISIDTRGPSTYLADAPFLLIIDARGDDEYRSGGNALGLDNAVSLLLDTAGDDRYVADRAVVDADGESATGREFIAAAGQEMPALFGAGVLGIGILYDTAGDDQYEAVQRCMGYGLFGIGLLADFAGDDRFTAIADGQGMAQAGMGVLFDLAGNDRYECYTRSQGFGYLDGLGCLLDHAGDDQYLANTTDIRFPASQSKSDPQNNSMAQGTGCGHRADCLDGHSYPGGVGLLIDGAGDDIYQCGIFGQGSGYWFGVGLCIDASGDDEYAGVWYVQGAAAHFAAGLLLDEAGNDRYEAKMATSLGTGHDLSLGFFADLGGNDQYTAGELTIGSGNAAGIGICVDVSGDDRYHVPADNTLGNANASGDVRSSMISFGLFLDGGGEDTYNHSYAHDECIWGNGPNRTFKRLDVLRFGIGLDTTMTAVQFERLWAPVGVTK